MAPISLYIHFPFCIHRCCYCDFNTYSGLEHLLPDYIEALCAEAEIVSRTNSEPYQIGTIYLGGGTPSLVDESSVAQLLGILSKVFYVKPDTEITMEVNPGTITAEYLKIIHEIGVNRLSIGMQSSNPFELKFLERIHDYFDVIQAIKWSRKAGFANVNLDLLFGLPGQSIKQWQSSLELASTLGPEHLSVYALTIEDRTPLGKWINNGLVELPDADIAADMYEWTSGFLSDHGYHHYEISNWAKHDTRSEIMSSRHNLQYWLNLPYLGLGAGAHGYVNNTRVMNVRHPEAYIRRLQDLQRDDRLGKHNLNQYHFLNSPAIVESLSIDRRTEMSETMMMGLRLVTQGISCSSFLERFGVPIEEAYGGELNKLFGLGLLQWTRGREAIILTGKGRLLGNQVFMEFV